MGLFGLDKLGNIPGTVDVLTHALDPILGEVGHTVPEAKAA